ncbi:MULTISPECIES: prephenate dehydratase [Archaeoglobus]|uniref:Prephenate dehydrogenase n=2 Tax=Archaeoglobus fulgidus TaxID=2234 RepID=A0A075W9J8_ARCFL|nr:MULTISPECIES: prephenate dehydratase [Archaeoglobus]AIG97045.1 chorismate mutase, archaeal type [Archaeoglobus fulgidus DSM 8774]KUJ94535.1 MAG: Chorismate mutase/prephenate dehydratase (PheA) [Archaeoglobus fulgidus]KUK07613.1 MAG: Chorismate mutase/prephenate dehydratase (PheA) [Archaeoglobus fulgidus]MDI3497727.1 chorismate mutase / prephenate dehydratase [Archaeoglobus sp.]
MKILIYGVGNMGKLFRDIFYGKGYYVRGYDIDQMKRDTNSISGFDVIFVCTPMYALEEALEHIKREAKKEALLVDVSSVKKVSVPLFEESGFDFLSIHPMLGGDSEISLSNVIVVRESGREEEKVILEELRKCGAVLSRLDVEEHDRKMAEIQGIAHFALVSMADFLRYGKEELKYASPIFTVLYKLASRIINQNWEMYFQIQKNAEDVREEYLRRAMELHEKMKDRESFREIFESLRKIYTDYESSTIILESYKATKKAESIEELRGLIKSIDSLILRLIERRIDAARQIARIKMERGEPIELKDVEEEKLWEVMSKTTLNPVKLKEIFEGIMSLAKEEEYKVAGVKYTIAVLGPQGSFSEEMALKLVGSRVPLRYCSTTDEIIKLVESGEVDYGLVPIENSVNGTVLPVIDALLNHDVEVFGEAKLEVNHCLVAKRKIELKEIKTIYSHPQAVAQCMGFINNYLPSVAIRYTTSTSDAARMLDDYSAAIMSENAARFYRLHVLRKGIQDLKGRNITRFYLIRRRSGRSEGKITSLFFGVEDKPGALKDVLEVFHKKGFNLRKLESRPAGTGLGDYVFFVEVEAPLREEDLLDLKQVTTFYKVVGVFDEVKRMSTL